METKAQKTYEISFLAKDENGAASLAGHLTRLGAHIVSEGEFSKIQLAYPIEKQSTAYSSCVHIDINPEEVVNIRDALKLDDNILRFLIITPPFYPEKQERISGEVKTNKPSYSYSQRPTTKRQPDASLSNDLLEEKLEEILK